MCGVAPPRAVGQEIPTVTNALPNAPAIFVLGVSRADVSLLGGTLVPFPDFLFFLATAPDGTLDLGGAWPPGVLPGIEFFFQCWIVDDAGPFDHAASNALAIVTP